MDLTEPSFTRSMRTWLKKKKKELYLLMLNIIIINATHLARQDFWEDFY